MALKLVIILSLKILKGNEPSALLSKMLSDSSPNTIFHLEKKHPYEQSESLKAYLFKDTFSGSQTQETLDSSFYLTIQKFSLCFILICLASFFGFCCGLKKRKQSYFECEPKSPLSIQSTAVSQFSLSPNYHSESPDFLPFTNIFSQASFGDLIMNGSYAKNFIQHKLLWQSSIEEVYLAEHKLDRRNYLVKIIPLCIGLYDNLNEQKFIREVSRIKKLDCRHLTRYVTCWVEEAHPNLLNQNITEILLYVQMEYIQGIPLSQWLKSSFSPDMGIKVIRQISKVLEYLHSRGIHHGEITLDNIFIDKYHDVVVGDYDYTRSISDDRKNFCDIVIMMLEYFPNRSQALNSVLQFKYIVDTELDSQFDEYLLAVDS
ncbi:hypothetical protein SteCoe_33517 [Stentor coeruleus]|uniref:Protein kinase domain-containing protein n=1 Tax=Stentor coeruleus TaxID=5963 RepID=A0A1R2AWY2_9CILI|nr:hypothetical protein SteCoe_33517 [Stentor coeruleus]